jgi:hypothetical protein
MLRDWSLRYATALTTALFLVMAVSGVALFFRLQTVAFKELHAWLGLVLVTASGLHLWRNWPAMLGYIRRGALKYPLIAALTASSAFAYAGLTAPSKTDPNRQLTAMFARAHLTEIAPLLHVDAEEIARKLRNRGFEVASTGQSLTEIAKASGRNEKEVIKTVGDDLASQRAGLKAE